MADVKDRILVALFGESRSLKGCYNEASVSAYSRAERIVRRVKKNG